MGLGRELLGSVFLTLCFLWWLLLTHSGSEGASAGQCWGVGSSPSRAALVWGAGRWLLCVMLLSQLSSGPRKLLPALGPLAPSLLSLLLKAAEGGDCSSGGCPRAGGEVTKQALFCSQRSRREMDLGKDGTGGMGGFTQFRKQQVFHQASPALGSGQGLGCQGQMQRHIPSRGS